MTDLENKVGTGDLGSGGRISRTEGLLYALGGVVAAYLACKNLKSSKGKIAAASGGAFATSLLYERMNSAVEKGKNYLKEKADTYKKK